MAITKKAAATKKAAKKTRARTDSGAFMSPKQLREHQLAMRSNG